MHQDYNDEQQKNLTEEEVNRLLAIKEDVDKLIEDVREPMDPKVLGLLEMISDMLTEQVFMDKRYDWGDCSGCGEDFAQEEESNKPYSFFTDENDNQQKAEGGGSTPSAEELKEWLND